MTGYRNEKAEPRFQNDFSTPPFSLFKRIKF